jgi:REP element-mobilizing transposase RayT
MLEKRRKNIRLARGSYEISSQIFSVTICTRDRRPLFQNETWAKLILTSLRTGPFGKQSKLYAYCLMSDHIHIHLSPLKTNLMDLINGWKSFTANLLRRNGLIGPCWQRGFYDHAIRKEEDIRTVAEYIVNNPVRAGLVENWVNHQFSWHRWI